MNNNPDIDTECPICFEPFDNSSITMTGCCKKQMHSNCYFKCMSLNTKCPMCRKSQQSLEVAIPIPVPVTIVREDSHRRFVHSVIFCVLGGISLALVVWKIETN